MKSKQEIFLEMFEPVKLNLWKFCLSISRNQSDAKDILQETIEKTYINLEKIQNKNMFLSYLFTTSSRIAQRNYKKVKLFTKLEENGSDRILDRSLNAEIKTDINILYDALKKLPAKYRDTIVLSDILGYSRKEICKLQKISMDALKSRLYRGRKKLASILGVENDIDNNFKKELENEKAI